MSIRHFLAGALTTVLLSLSQTASAQSGPPLTLQQALQRVVAANPKLAAAEREIGIAAGKKLQAGAIPNPEVSYDIEQVHGSGDYRGHQSAETTLQLSQVIELGGKREARIAVGSAELESAHWQRAATRLEILSEAAVAFFNILSAQRRVQIYDTQIAALNRLTPLLQRRVDAGASSPAEVLRAQVAADLVRAERERTNTALAIARRELTAAMGADTPGFSRVVGDMTRIGRPPVFQTVLRAVDANPQLMRWTAIRAQRDAELLSARLKPVPDVRLSAGRQHFRAPPESHDYAYRFGLSLTVPLWDQNRGGVLEAQEAIGKADAERAASRATLILTLGKAYDTLVGSLREIELLQNTVLPNARKMVEGMESGYSQGRFSLIELLDVQSTATQAALREQEALLNFYTSVATLEALTGVPVTLSRARPR